MKSTLVIPRPAITQGGTQLLINSKAVYRFALRWTDHHPASHYGLGVLLDSVGEVVDGFMFRYLRDTLGAWIQTDDPAAAAHCLGVPWQDDWREDGIGQPPKAGPKPRDVNEGHVKR